jgi:DNA mismatch repair protein MutS2
MIFMKIPEYKNAVRVLELDLVFEKLFELAVSELGQKKLSEQPFFTDAGSLTAELRRVTEMRDLLCYDDPFPLHPFPNIRSRLKKAVVPGAFLSGPDLIAVQDVLALSRKVRRFLDARSEKYALLCGVAQTIIPLESVEKTIGSQLDPAGEVKDGASSLLARIRRDLTHQRDILRRRLEHLLRAMIKAGYAQDETLVLRQGRLVIPMKENHQARMKGIVVDQSASGATVFIEPLEALEIGNELRKLEILESQEIERILKELTAFVARHSDVIEINLESLAVLDSIAARARYSISVKGNAAFISDDGIFDLKQAVHPLLLLKHKSEEVVPLSLTLGGDTRTLVITGPNAGGKTVALKTAGLLSMMHFHGMHIPGGEGSRIPMLSSVFADIGDRQSIEQDLSTFSSHIQNLRMILDRADDRSLVLLDEIGSATDPAEGGALAMGILKTLTQRKSLTIATTHIGLLKVFAHDEAGVENGSMVFDQETLKPTYRFQAGIPGSSYAFEIAEKMGFQESVLRQAREFVGQDRGRLDRLIFDLEDRLRNAEMLQREAAIKESRSAELIRLVESRLQSLKTDAESQKKLILEEAENLLREINAMKERVLKEIRETNGDSVAVRELNREIRNQQEKLSIHKKSIQIFTKSVDLKEGDWVMWRGQSGTGRVISPPDNQGRLLVEWNDIRLRISSKELDQAPEPAVRESRPGFVKFEVERLSGNELDIRGKTVDEAIEILDRYLSDAVAGGFNIARVIHGKGTGVLRKHVQQYLQKHPLVKSQRFGEWNEGDVGVTIVEFK